MTPKEKAVELLEQCRLEILDREGSSVNSHIAKQCAIFTVNEILKSFGLLANGATFYTSYNTIKFYQEVKLELQKL